MNKPNRSTYTRYYFWFGLPILKLFLYPIPFFYPKVKKGKEREGSEVSDFEHTVRNRTPSKNSKCLIDR